MTMEISRNTLINAANYVDECSQHAEIHTVTLITSGHTGGVDVKIEGFVRLPQPGSIDTESPYERTYELPTGYAPAGR